jgi:cyclic beta-1,2-glucan synthetase
VVGWERKRGKLHELNRLLRGASDTTFIGSDGRAPAVPPGVRYVITLDADTRLPRDAVRRLVGKMAHPPAGVPLNPWSIWRRFSTAGGAAEPQLTLAIMRSSRPLGTPSWRARQIR